MSVATALVNKMKVRDGNGEIHTTSLSRDNLPQMDSVSHPYQVTTSPSLLFALVCTHSQSLQSPKPTQLTQTLQLQKRTVSGPRFVPFTLPEWWSCNVLFGIPYTSAAPLKDLSPSTKPCPNPRQKVKQPTKADPTEMVPSLGKQSCIETPTSRK